MPLSFVPLGTHAEALVLNKEEKNFLGYIHDLGPTDDDSASRYSFAVNIEIRFIRSTAKGAFEVKVTDNPKALQIQLTEEQVLERYPWDYRRLTEKCRGRYSDFKVDSRYHHLRRGLESDSHFVHIRLLDPDNPRSSMKRFFHPRIMTEFDKYYTLA